MERDRDILITENIDQFNHIDELKERITSLEDDVVHQNCKQVSELAFLRKRSTVESYGAFEIEERHPEKRKSNTDQLAKRITALTKKFLSK